MEKLSNAMGLVPKILNLAEKIVFAFDGFVGTNCAGKVVVVNDSYLTPMLGTAGILPLRSRVTKRFLSTCRLERVNHLVFVLLMTAGSIVYAVLLAVLLPPEESCYLEMGSLTKSILLGACYLCEAPIYLTPILDA